VRQKLLDLFVGYVLTRIRVGKDLLLVSGDLILKLSDLLARR